MGIGSPRLHLKLALGALPLFVTAAFWTPAAFADGLLPASVSAPVETVAAQAVAAAPAPAAPAAPAVPAPPASPPVASVLQATSHPAEIVQRVRKTVASVAADPARPARVPLSRVTTVRTATTTVLPTTTRTSAASNPAPLVTAADPVRSRQPQSETRTRPSHSRTRVHRRNARTAGATAGFMPLIAEAPLGTAPSFARSTTPSLASQLSLVRPAAQTIRTTEDIPLLSFLRARIPTAAASASSAGAGSAPLDGAALPIFLPQAASTRMTGFSRFLRPAFFLFRLERPD
jgi:hypothetical protein